MPTPAMEFPFRALNVSLVAVAAILGSLLLARSLQEEEQRVVPSTEPVSAQAVDDLDLESIRAAGF